MLKYLLHVCGHISLLLTDIAYRIQGKESTLSFLALTLSIADLEISKQVGFGNAIRSSDFHGGNLFLPNQFVPGFGADLQNLAHLVNVQYVRVFSQHDTISVALTESLVTDFGHLLSNKPVVFIPHGWRPPGQ